MARWLCWVLLLGSLPAVAAPAARYEGPLWSEGAAQANPVASGLPELSTLVRRSSPAVVSITVEEARAPELAPNDPLHDFFERYYGGEPLEGLGTGFVIHAAGLILTNSHVVENAGRITVRLEDQGYPEELEATVLGRDPDTDLAILAIDAKRPLPVLPLGDSDEVDIADWVVAIGNPFGLTQSVTFGIVSQKGRTDISPQGRDGYFDFIQTDASINPGNSGGPLLNLDGEVVAINNAINASGQGIGFAVPINMAKRVIPQLVREGRVTHAWLGLAIQELDPASAKVAGLRRPMGVLISEVTPGGPAALAGLEVGDVIVSFGGVRVASAPRLRWDVACASVGSNVGIELIREGRRMELAVRPLPQPKNLVAVEMPAVHFLDGLGFAVEDLNPEDAVTEGLPGLTGARIVNLDPTGISRRAGLRRGDLVTGVFGEAVVSAADLSLKLRSAPPGSLLELLVLRDGEELRVQLRVPDSAPAAHDRD